MATKYYTEYTTTGNTLIQIEDYLFINRTSGFTGLNKFPQTRLDVDGQIRLNSGSTNLEGELRYVSNKLYINTGGTASSWAPVSTLSVSNNSDSYILTATGGNTINGEVYLRLNNGNINFDYPTHPTITHWGDYAIYNLMSTGTSTQSTYNFYKVGYDVDINDYLGTIQWLANFNTSGHLTSSISVETSERWEDYKYGSDMYFKTTATADAIPATRIAIVNGDTKIQNGNLRVDNNLYVTGSIYNLNNVGRFASNLITTSNAYYTGLTTDFTIITTKGTAGDTIVVLPVALSFHGRILNIKNMNSSSSVNLAVTSGSGDSIVYASEPPTLGKGDAITVQSNGGHIWYVIAFMNVP